MLFFIKIKLSSRLCLTHKRVTQKYRNSTLIKKKKKKTCARIGIGDTQNFLDRIGSDLKKWYRCIPRELGMHVKIYSYESWFCLLAILMDSQVSKSLKQRFLILLLSPCSASLWSSDQLQQTVPIIHLFSHSNEKHYKWTRVRLLCCIKALIRIKPYIKS